FFLDHLHQHDLPSFDDFLNLVLAAEAGEPLLHFLQRVGAANRLDGFVVGVLVVVGVGGRGGEPVGPVASVFAESFGGLRFFGSLCFGLLVTVAVTLGSQRLRGFILRRVLVRRSGEDGFGAVFTFVVDLAGRSIPRGRIWCGRFTPGRARFR